MRNKLTCLLIAAILFSIELYPQAKNLVKLPEPIKKGTISVEEALQNRRSKRKFKQRQLTMSEVSQLLWAAYGTTKDGFFKTTPSAGSMYGLEIYLVAGMVNGLEAGIYKYKPKTHELELVRQGDFRYELADAALAQLFVEKAPVTLIVAAVYERLENKYTEKGIPFAHLEAGHSGQNIYLQATAMNLGTCAVSSFVPADVKKLVNMPINEEPVYLFPVGEPE